MLKLQETQNQIKINEAVKLKDQEINQLKNDIKLQESNNQIQTQEVIDSKEKEIIELKNKIKNLDDKQRISDLELNKKYSGQITLLKEEIHRIKNFQSSLTKEIGEDLEKYCATEFEILRQDAYRNAQFVKDNNLVNGTKGDYIFRDFDDDGDEITSIMFDMKNEREESKNKSKNSKFYEKLNKDRINKKCSYYGCYGSWIKCIFFCYHLRAMQRHRSHYYFSFNWNYYLYFVVLDLLLILD